MKDLPMLFGATMGKANLSHLAAALVAFSKAATATDAQMTKAEAAGDSATMQKLAAQEAQARGAFYVAEGLSFNKYVHTMDRVFVSYPEVLFAGDDPKAQQAAIDRMTDAITNATNALAPKT
jgi:hypothetical protein